MTTMNCRDVRELLDSYLGEELLVETTHEILRHLEACPECRIELERRRELRAGLRRAFLASAELAPAAGFLDQTHVMLAAHRAQPRSRWRFFGSGWGAMAAAAVLMLAVSAFGAANWTTARLLALARDAWGDHKNCAIAFHLLERPMGLPAAARQYGPIYETLETAPPDTVGTPEGEARVLERHACVFNGIRFAHVVFRYQDQVVSLLVANDRAGAMTSAVDAVRAKFEGPTRTFAVDGAATPASTDDVVTFRIQGHEAMLVGAKAPALRTLAAAISKTVAP